MKASRWRSARLVPAALFAWGAAGLVVSVPGMSVAAALASWCVAVGGVVVVVLVRGKPRALILVSCGVVALVSAALVAGTVGAASGSRAEARALGESGRSAEVTAVISGKLNTVGSGDVWFDALAETIRVGQQVVDAQHPIRVGVTSADAAQLVHADIGTRLTLRGAVFAPQTGERAVLVVRADAIERDPRPPNPLLAGASNLRRALVASAATMPGRGADLVPGLSVGDTSPVDDLLDEDMKASSLSHLTAVSGANCALVVGVAFGAAALCGARRGVRVVLGLVALGGFVLIVTPEPSVVRAAMMAAIAMLSLALGRTGAGLSVLCLAVIVLLATDPWLALEIGFALSAAATAALLTLARPLASGLARWMPAPLAFALAVPLAAQLACGPLLVLIDPRVPLLGVVANLLAGPAAPLATLAGFAACLLPALPWLQDGLVAIAWVPASWIAGVATTIGDIPVQSIPWMEGPFGALTLALASVLIVFVVASGNSLGRRSLLRRLAGPALLVIFAIGAGQAVLRTTAGPLTVPPDWAIAVCDVGQGDAVLLRSAGRIALIDTGRDAEVLDECLARWGVSRIELLVLTHFDADHSGGVASVLGRVDTALHGPSGGKRDERILDRLREGGARVMSAQTGMSGFLGEASWQTLWPPAGQRAGNDASVVIEVEGGESMPRGIFLGDLSAEAQRALRRMHDVARFDVVKVAHHGSADQDKGLYARVSAPLAVIPVGADNEYGHPRESLLRTLDSLGTHVARTDRHGALAVWRERDGGVHLWRERDVPADH